MKTRQARCTPALTVYGKRKADSSGLIARRAFSVATTWALQVFPGDLQPTAAALNGVPCALQTALPPPPPPAAAESVGSLSTQDGRIIGPDGRPLFLWGINYFGFEVGATMVDGLWAGAHDCGAPPLQMKSMTSTCAVPVIACILAFPMPCYTCGGSSWCVLGMSVQDKRHTLKGAVQEAR